MVFHAQSMLATSIARVMQLSVGNLHIANLSKCKTYAISQIASHVLVQNHHSFLVVLLGLALALPPAATFGFGVDFADPFAAGTAFAGLMLLTAEVWFGKGCHLDLPVLDRTTKLFKATSVLVASAHSAKISFGVSGLPNGNEK